MLVQRPAARAPPAFMLARPAVARAGRPAPCAGLVFYTVFVQFLCLDPHRLSVASRCPAPFSTVPCAQVGGLGAAGEATRARVWSAAPSCSAEVALRPLGDAGRRNRPRRRFSDCGPSVRQHVTAYEKVVKKWHDPKAGLKHTTSTVAKHQAIV